MEIVDDFLKEKKRLSQREIRNRIYDLSKDIRKALGDHVDYIVARIGISQARLHEPMRSGDHVGMLTIYVTEDTTRNVDHTRILQKMREIDTSYLEEVTFKEEANGPPVGEAIDVTLNPALLETE